MLNINQVCELSRASSELLKNGALPIGRFYILEEEEPLYWCSLKDTPEAKEVFLNWRDNQGKNHLHRFVRGEWQKIRIYSAKDTSKLIDHIVS